MNSTMEIPINLLKVVQDVVELFSLLDCSYKQSDVRFLILFPLDTFVINNEHSIVNITVNWLKLIIVFLI